MEDISLPRHIIESVERRWMSKLEQAARAWKSDQRTSVAPRILTIDEGRRHIPVVTRRGRTRSGRPERQLPTHT